MENAIALDSEIKAIRMELEKLQDIGVSFSGAEEKLRALHSRMMWIIGNREEIHMEDCSVKFDGAYLRFMNATFEIKLGIKRSEARELAYNILKQTEKKE